MLAPAMMIERKAAIVVLEAGTYLVVSDHELLEGELNRRDGCKHPCRRRAERGRDGEGGYCKCR